MIDPTFLRIFLKALSNPMDIVFVVVVVVIHMLVHPTLLLGGSC
jgi:hypothetical protein